METWPAASVNARIGPIANGVDAKGKPQTISAGEWLDKNRAVEQMTWCPGEPMLIEGRLVANGGWIERPGVTCFNLYRPPLNISGDDQKAGQWLDHARDLYGDETAARISKYFPFKVQKPNIKINHALLLGGAQGIGKDTLIEPLKYAVGPWNFEEVAPPAIFGRFNGYVKSVFLRISEVRDLGDGNRFDFYERMKTLTASPPDVLRVDEKHLREYAVFNVCGVIITTNYKHNGIYLPSDDRRHYVAWSDKQKSDYNEAYWKKLWHWYQNEDGIDHVIAYLQTLDISDFDPKAPPPKTEAFWSIVDANRSPENAELDDAIDKLGERTGDGDGELLIIRPKILTLEKLSLTASAALRLWLEDRKNRRIIPHRLEDCGFEPVRNDTADDGLWKINGKRQAVYARRDLSTAERVRAVR